MLVKNRLLNFDNMYIYQNNDWFTFSLDSVLLANFVTINLRDKKIIDLATGNAPVLMLLSLRTKANMYGVELQKEVYDLAIKSININNLGDQIKIINDDVKNLLSYFRSDSFDVITCNPPYFKYKDGCNINNNMIKAIARHEKELKLEDVIAISSKLLKNGGRLALVHRPYRLIEIILLMKKYNMVPKKIRFVYPKRGYDCNILLIEATKNGNDGNLKIMDPLYVYDDFGEYTFEVRRMFGE